MQKGPSAQATVSTAPHELMKFQHPSLDGESWQLQQLASGQALRVQPVTNVPYSTLQMYIVASHVITTYSGQPYMSFV